MSIAQTVNLQIDMLGQPIWDYAHACDHEELREALNGRKTSPSEVLTGAKKNDFNPLAHRSIMLRLKCTLTKSGRFVNIKSAAYKVSPRFSSLSEQQVNRKFLSGDPLDRARCLPR